MTIDDARRISLVVGYSTIDACCADMKPGKNNLANTCASASPAGSGLTAKGGHTHHHHDEHYNTLRCACTSDFQGAP